MAGHAVGRLALIIITLIVFLVMVFINFGASIPGVAEILYGSEEGANMQNLEKYTIEINPAGWTFSVWGLIYLWNGVMIAYILSMLCRKGPDGYLYVSPNLFPVGFYISYIINNLLNGAWLMIAAREWLHAGLAIIFLMWVTLIVCLVLSHIALQRNMDALKKFEMMKEVWMIRFMVHNALGIYCGWITVATQLNLGIVLAHFIGIDMSLTCTICLGILAVEVASWVILDFFIFHKFTNYMFSPYLVVMWALIGSVAHNFNPWQKNTIMTVVLLGVVVLATLAKFILMFLRHCRNSNLDAVKMNSKTEKNIV